MQYTLTKTSLLVQYSSLPVSSLKSRSVLVACLGTEGSDSASAASLLHFFIVPYRDKQSSEYAIHTDRLICTYVRTNSPAQIKLA